MWTIPDHSPKKRCALVAAMSTDRRRQGWAVHSTVRQIYREQVFFRTGIEFVDLAGSAAQTIADFVETIINRRGRTCVAGPEREWHSPTFDVGRVVA